MSIPTGAIAKIVVMRLDKMLQHSPGTAERKLAHFHLCAEGIVQSEGAHTGSYESAPYDVVLEAIEHALANLPLCESPQELVKANIYMHSIHRLNT